MRYTLEQKLLAIGDDFSAFDEMGNCAYIFDGKVFSLGKKIIVQDSTGRHIAVIRRRLFTFRPTFIIKRRDEVIATIYKRFFSIRKSLVIHVPGNDQITITGEILEHNYSFFKNGIAIAEISKKWFKGRDTYTIDIVEVNEDLLVLCAAVVIDLLCHPKRDSGFRNSKV